MGILCLQVLKTNSLELKILNNITILTYRGIIIHVELSKHTSSYHLDKIVVGRIRLHNKLLTNHCVQRKRSD